MNRRENMICGDCDQNWTRREFVRNVGLASAAGAVIGLGTPAGSAAAARSDRAAETAVKKFYDTLTEPQKGTICFPFDHDLRRKISANWEITKPTIGSDFYTDDQRELIHNIFAGVTSQDGFERLRKQMEDDMGGFGEYHIAVFGQPGSDKFQWEMTGRHLTLRADGDSVENMAFGGPIVYGHGESDPKQNLFHYQTRKANEVFQALDPKQRDLALLAKAPPESRVPLQGKQGKFPGLPVRELSADQQQLVEDVVKVILAPYRTEDVEESISLLKQGGGFEALSMAFYREEDLDDDQVWDIWRVEGPSFVCHFRGAPHVHAYINIGLKQT